MVWRLEFKIPETDPAKLPLGNGAYLQEKIRNGLLQQYEERLRNDGFGIHRTEEQGVFYVSGPGFFKVWISEPYLYTPHSATVWGDQTYNAINRVEDLNPDIERLKSIGFNYVTLRSPEEVESLKGMNEDRAKAMLAARAVRRDHQEHDNGICGAINRVAVAVIGLPLY
jgi:hypothetical protein